MLREMNQLTEAKDAKIAEKKLPKNLRRRTGGTSASSVVLSGSRIEMCRCAVPGFCCCTNVAFALCHGITRGAIRGCSEGPERRSFNLTKVAVTGNLGSWPRGRPRLRHPGCQVHMYMLSRPLRGVYLAALVTASRAPKSGFP